MTQNSSPIDQLMKLSTLIEGYQGYRTIEERAATTEIYEAFLSERLKTILKIIEDRYNDLITEKKNLHLLMPLSNVIKNLTDCFQFTTYEKSQRLFFLNEYRFPWEGIEDKLYKIDYTILQYISMLVDKISHFERESDSRFEAFIQVALVFREKLSERKKFIYNVSEKLTPVNELLNSSIHDIRERRLSEKTFQNIEKALQIFPDRLNTYIEIFQAIQRYSTYYVRINENIPLIDFYDTAMLFIAKYRQYTEMLKQFVKRAPFDTDEEKDCKTYLQDRLSKSPDFSKLTEALQVAREEAEKKQAILKGKEHIMQLATAEFRKAQRFEKEYRYIEAIALYQKTLYIDKEYMEATEAIERCQRKQKAFSLYIKAHRKMKAGQIEKALSLFKKIIKKAPDFNEASYLIEKLEKDKAEKDKEDI